ncbi:MAG: L,D-transpeptidase family protein [Chitinophagales bacterium]|nr:L,D-transpeptidase family protein [Chitinophagales bacterium]
MASTQFYGRHVLVNIANFTMYMLEDNKLIFQKRVCVGKPFSQTPVFSDQIEYLEFNPYWTVPYSIASNEILPKLRKKCLLFGKPKYGIAVRWKKRSILNT